MCTGPRTGTRKESRLSPRCQGAFWLPSHGSRCLVGFVPQLNCKPLEVKDDLFLGILGRWEDLLVGGLLVVLLYLLNERLNRKCLQSRPASPPGQVA